MFQEFLTRDSGKEHGILYVILHKVKKLKTETNTIPAVASKPNPYMIFNKILCLSKVIQTLIKTFWKMNISLQKAATQVP